MNPVKMSSVVPLKKALQDLGPQAKLFQPKVFGVGVLLPGEVFGDVDPQELNAV